MSPSTLIQFAAPTIAALAGGAFGWWLRGRPTSNNRAPINASNKQVAAKLLQNLQAAADTVRSCVEQHSECIRTIQAELNEVPSTEPMIITRLADSIVASTKLMQHQCNDIRKSLHDERKEIRDTLASCDRLLFTFASLDRQKQAYRQVLSSLETLAAELSGEINGHGQRLKSIRGSIENCEEQTADGLAAAVTQILDATANIRQRVETTEQKISAQAESIEMQAVLTHTDLLTALPNRRALDAELLHAATRCNRAPLATLILLDLDAFAHVNHEYGHPGGDVILRQAADELKQQARSRDMVARFCGDTFAVLLNQTTMHDALPLAEKIRKHFEDTHFSHGAHNLHLTASLGIAQLRPEELRSAITHRAEEALSAARAAGGNACFRHDGTECVPVSSVFQARAGQPGEESLSLAALWRDTAAENAHASNSPSPPVEEGNQELTGRSLFAANLGRRLAEWKRGGANVSVAVLRVDQMQELIARFGEQGRGFLRQVIGRLLEATTRDMDERCEFEDGLFALSLPGTDESSALAVADRLCAQVRQCKVRMGRDLWDLSASIGVASCDSSARVMDIMLSAEQALQLAAEKGGDQVCMAQNLGAPLAANR